MYFIINIASSQQSKSKPETLEMLSCIKIILLTDVIQIDHVDRLQVWHRYYKHIDILHSDENLKEKHTKKPNFISDSYIYDN